MTYIIYSEESFETEYGTIHKGDIINTIQGEKEDEDEIINWLINQYVLEGIKISYKYTRG